MTGTDEFWDNVSTSECSNTRAKMMLLNRLSTRAVSSRLSFWPSWMSRSPRYSAWPPKCRMPISVLTRVRVLRFWKIMPMLSPASGVNAAASAAGRVRYQFFSADAVASSCSTSCWLKSFRLKKCRWRMSTTMSLRTDGTPVGC